MLQMVREAAFDAEPQARPVSNARFMQCRLPAEQYEWLRYRAFINRTSMNSIVLEAITDLQTEAKTNVPLTLLVTPGTSGGVKFNVRLSEETYEWLRTVAFDCRGSINQLLIGALAAYRKRQGS
ncbi:MAG TPA: hypothetical protein VNL71_01530 [Chloroflexota bacterium]|nr:hypothetical protein [Chloroflexota bacterium]